MPIIAYPVLNVQSAAFQSGLQQLMQLRRIPEGLTIYPNRYPVYNLGARDVLTQLDPSAAARLVSWRYFANGSSGGVTVSGDVNLASPPRVVSLSYGTTIREDLRTAGKLVDLPDLGNHSYDPRLLRIPGLYVEAFWLKSMPTGDESDLIVPYHTPLVNLDPAKPIPAADFFGRLRYFAQQAITNSNAPKTAPKRVTVTSRSPKEAGPSSLH